MSAALQDFLKAYQVATVWANGYQEGPDGAEPLDSDQHHDEAITSQVDTESATDFFKANRKDMKATGGTWDQHGHDFALTRNRHGAGFWDRGYGELGRTLTDAAHAYGDHNVYVSEDGSLVNE